MVQDPQSLIRLDHQDDLDLLPRSLIQIPVTMPGHWTMHASGTSTNLSTLAYRACGAPLTAAPVSLNGFCTVVLLLVYGSACPCSHQAIAFSERSRHALLEPRWSLELAAAHCLN